MSEKRNVIVRIAGAAGDGIASSGEAFGKTCSRMGLQVMAYNAFQSAIRGGHVWLQLNVGNYKTLSHGEEPDVLLLLNKTGVNLHLPQMKKGGLVFYNSSSITQDLTEVRDDLTYCPVPFKEIITDNVPLVMVNVLLMGALMQSLGLDTKVAEDFIVENFEKRKKGQDIIDLNKKIFNAGKDYSKANFKALEKIDGDGKQRLFMTGNEAIGLGLLAHGLKFYAAYPMSPSTGVLHYLATRAKTDNIVVKQVEDEIAAINWVIGAAHSGVRAATATAGGGFALMVEALGLSGMLETPIVVFDVMRGGPSTGIPTKQEQSDLNLVMGGSGDFPKIVLAPKDTEDAFYTAGRAMNLAEKYQTPVIVMSDTFLSEHFQTVDGFDFDKVGIDRGKLLRSYDGPGLYKRYEHSDDGISPRLIPGAKGGMYVAASDEHDERGIVISDVLAGLPESIEVRNRIHPRRMKKLETMRNEDMQAPELRGTKDAEITLMGWGATYDMITEACELLTAEGYSVNQLHFTDLFPMNREKVREVLESCKDIVAIENNISNQFPKLLLSETAFEVKKSINKFDGEPFTGEYIANAVKNLSTKKELANV